MMTLLDLLDDSVAKLHARGWPDHRIAARLRITHQRVAAERKRLGLTAHPANSRLTEAQVSAEITRWAGFIWKTAQRWSKRYPELDVADLHSEALVGCLIAGERYDPRRTNAAGKRLTFMTYADWWMRNCLQRFVRRELCGGFAASLNGRIERCGPIRLGERVVRDRRGVPDVDEFAHLVRILPPDERQVVTWHYRDGLGERELARRLHVSVDKVRGILSASLRMLRNDLVASG